MFDFNKDNIIMLNDKKRNVDKPVPIPNITSCCFLYFFSIAFAENTLVQKTMVKGLETVNIKQLVKLLTGVQATEPACPALLINARPLYKIINPNSTSITELTIPKIFFILSF